MTIKCLVKSKPSTKNYILLIYSLLFCRLIFSQNSFDLPKEKGNELLNSQATAFIENKGQLTDMKNKPVPFVLFKSQVHGMNLYITEKGLTYVFLKSEEKNASLKKKEKGHSANTIENPTTEWERIDMSLKGAKIKKENIIKENKSDDFSQYFFPHCPKGISDVHSYKKITIKEIYPGIDWELYNADENGVKYNFIVHPGANHQHIELLYASLKPLQMNDKGNLEIKSKLAILTENAPVCYQMEKNIASNFVVSEHKELKTGGYETHVKFEIQNYSHTDILVIDPQLVWSTPVGGINSVNSSMAITTDRYDNVFITGFCQGDGVSDFPVLDAGGGSYFNGLCNGILNLFITKFDSTSRLTWSTYYGGLYLDIARGICTDNLGNVFITGFTDSPDFPVYDPKNGAYFREPAADSSRSIFILKFSNNGNQLWATTYLGAEGKSICTDIYNNVFITGETYALDLDVLNPGGSTYFQKTPNGGANTDGFILKFDNLGKRLWATYFGGTEFDNIYDASICSDKKGNIFITGDTYRNFPGYNPGNNAYYQKGAGGIDAYVAKFNNTGTRLWATVYGGTGDDMGSSICLGPSGDVFIKGYTTSTDLPLLDPGNGAYHSSSGDAFLLKFNNEGNLHWATYFKGNRISGIINTNSDIVVDECNNIYASFSTAYKDMPLQAPPDNSYYYDPTYNGDQSDLFITKFSSSYAYEWGSYFGGNKFDSGQALALDKSNHLYMTGNWSTGQGILWGSYPTLNAGGNSFFGPFANYQSAYISKFAVKDVTTGPPLVTNSNCECNGSAKINVLTGSPSFNWYNSKGTLIGNQLSISNLCPGDYKVIMTDETCKQKTIDLKINNTNIIASIAGSDTMCMGDTIVLTAKGGSSYAWNTGATTPTILVSPSSQTIYSVVASKDTCTASAMFTVNVIPYPNASITGKDSICQGQELKLMASGGRSYLWNTNSTSSEIKVLPHSDTTYSVVVSNGYCLDTASISITINPLPIVNAGNDIITSYGQPVQLFSTGEGKFAWLPTTGLNCASCQDPIALPPYTTMYCVSITDSHACTANDCITISVPVVIPNIFTPNNDGISDVFFIEGLQPNTALLTIYNCWGQLIYKSSNYANDWDGRNCSDGVYYYILNDTIEDKAYRGSIHIIR